MQAGGTGLWVPATGEYAVAEPWRRRGDIANIVEVTARTGERALVTALLERLKASGNRLTLLADDAWRAQSRLYLDLGFNRLETIVFFEKQLGRAVSAPTGAQGAGGPQLLSGSAPWAPWLVQ